MTLRLLLTMGIFSDAIVTTSGRGLLHGVFVLIIVGAVLGLILYFLSISPMPEPFKKVITWIIYGIGVLVLINFLLSLIGYPIIAIT